MQYKITKTYCRYLLAGHKLKLYYDKLRSGEAAAAPYLIKTELERRIFYFLVLGPDGSSTGITHLMFEPTIAKQASEEQRDAWLPAARRMVCTPGYALCLLAPGAPLTKCKPQGHHRHVRANGIIPRVGRQVFAHHRYLCAFVVISNPSPCLAD